jgi:neutral ceramidase
MKRRDLNNSWIPGLDLGLNLSLSLALCMLLVGCHHSGSSSSGSSSTGSTSSGGTPAVLPAKAYCVLQSPRLQIGSSPTLTVDGVTYTNSHQPDAPSPLETPIANPGPQPAGSCNGNKQYRFGTGLYDTTGPLGGDPTGHADFFGEVLPPQVPNGIHTRPFARAFDIESPCNNTRVMFVSVDMMGISGLLHQEVMKRIAADSTLSAFYDMHNVMLSAIHTHEVDGGFGLGVLPDLSGDLPAVLNNVLVYAESTVISNPTYDDDNFNAIVNGIVQAIRRAHANLQAHADTAGITLAVSQLLNANTNRDPPAYQQDSPSERAQYTDTNGHEVPVDKRFLQLNFVRSNGTPVGVLNWFAVHPTAMGNHALLMSSDNKGYASLGFERLMGTQYVPDADGTATGVDNFVAGFAQTDEGNSIPDLFVFDKDLNGNDGSGQGVPYQFRLGTDDPYNFNQTGYELGEREATAVSGTKQLAEALTDFTKGTAISGPVDYRFFYADLSADLITDPVVLSGLTFADEPADLYTPTKTTCTSGYGISQFAGGANAPDFGAAGYACNADAPSPYLDQVRNGYGGIYNGTGYVVAEQDDTPVEIPFNSVAVYSAATPLLCQATQLQTGYGCQAEKPVTTAANTNPVPIQIFRVGNLAILGVPLEVTAMSGRRLRKTVLDALSPAGVDTVVIAGLSNDYHEYMATREEYSAQMYEGASTIFGPWQLGAIQQESRKLALTMANGQPAPTGLAAAVLTVGQPSPITTDPANSSFGSLVTDALPSYTQGNTVDVTWVAGYPGNDLKTMSSYLFAEHQNAQGGWDVVAVDRDPELTFIWHSTPTIANTEANYAGASTAEALWTIPLDTPAGTYRIRHEGVDRTSASAPAQNYEGISSPFTITGTPAACP